MSTGAVRVLITGVNGQVGGALASTAEAEGFIVLRAARDDLDLGKSATIKPFLDQYQPDIVVNCAAYTAVDQAEKEPALAFAINAEAPGALAAWCAERDRPLIHLSTDYVFPGDASRPYREEDPTGPSSVYGASKLEGERKIREACPRHLIFRTAWVYAAEGKNFVRTMLRLGAERDALNVVADQWGCPTSADSIAQALCSVLRTVGHQDVAAIAGTYHYVDRGETTWHGFADRIFAGAEARWGRRPTVQPITTDQYPTPAKRPSYSVLDTTKFQSVFGRVPPAWQDSLDAVLAQIFS
jgi:dTDP-4-dehydrorhamnose reductase